jgi:hypothetical protein
MVIVLDEDRQALAEFLEIDWTRFEVTPEYLKKKTKAEILKFISTESGLRDEKLFLDYLRDYKLPTTMEKLAACKKGVLVNLILNCGVDLRGRLPKEIKDKPDLFAPEEVVTGHSYFEGEFSNCVECNDLHPESSMIEVDDDLLCPNCARDNTPCNQLPN